MKRTVSHFSLELSRLIEERGLRDVAVASKAALSPSIMSRVRSGRQKTIKPGTFIALTNAVAEKPEDKTRLLVAHLRDLSRGLPGADWVQIGPSPSKNQVITQLLAELPPSLERALATLLEECLSDPNWGEIVVDLAEWIERKKSHKQS